MKYLILLAATAILGCNKSHSGHACQWPSCPYKRITLADYPAHADGQPGTALYNIDSLHLVYPGDCYDQLEEKLNN